MGVLALCPAAFEHLSSSWCRWDRMPEDTIGWDVPEGGAWGAQWRSGEVCQLRDTELSEKNLTGQL